MCQWSTMVPALSSNHHCKVQQWNNPDGKHMYLTTTLQSQTLHLNALLLYLMTGALERSTFSSRGGAQTTTRPDYDLSLQHPPTLWAKRQQRFSNRLCIAPEGRFNSPPSPRKQHGHVWHPPLLALQHIANFRACSQHQRRPRGSVQNPQNLPG